MREDPEFLEAEILEDPQEPRLEPGGLPSRFGALCLDLILLIAVFGLVTTKIILPRWHPEAIPQFVEIVEQYESADENTPPATPSPELLEAARTVNTLFFLSIFFYFTLIPPMFGGGTLGMRIFNLRIQDQRSNAPAPLRAHLVRGALKTVCLQILFPFLTLLFLFALRNSDRITLHDRLAKTRVVRAPAFRSQ